MKRQTRSSMLGAIAIETALIFPVFFGMVWSVLSYALPFFILETMHHAASEAARFATRADSQLATVQYRTKLEELASAKAAESLGMLPTSAQERLQTTAQVITIATTSYLSVKITYPAYATNPVIPVIVLPGFGPIPNLPGDLVAEARYRLP